MTPSLIVTQLAHEPVLSDVHNIRRCLSQQRFPYLQQRGLITLSIHLPCAPDPNVSGPCTCWLLQGAIPALHAHSCHTSFRGVFVVVREHADCPQQRVQAHLGTTMQLTSNKICAARSSGAQKVHLHHQSSRALLSVHHQQQQHQRQHDSQRRSLACRTSLADVGPSFSNGGNSSNPLELLRVTRDVQV